MFISLCFTSEFIPQIARRLGYLPMYIKALAITHVIPHPVTFLTCGQGHSHRITHISSWDLFFDFAEDSSLGFLDSQSNQGLLGFARQLGISLLRVGFCPDGNGSAPSGFSLRPRDFLYRTETSNRILVLYACARWKYLTELCLGRK